MIQSPSWLNQSLCQFKFLAGPSDSMTMLVTHLLVSIATAALFVVGLSEREAAQGTAFELVWWTRL